MKTFMPKKAEIERSWWVVDATNIPLGRLASQVAYILRGKNKPTYTTHEDMGDYVIIINSDKADVSGNKANDKMYRRVSGYAGGLKEETYNQMIVRKPTYPMEHAIKGMLPKGPLGRRLFANLHVYSSSEHPHAAQKPVKIDL